jgi:hypothetical protein
MREYGPSELKIAIPHFLRAGNPEVVRSPSGDYCWEVRRSYPIRIITPKAQLGMSISPYLPTPSLRRNVIIGHQFVNPD